ncbi:MAG: hypothetical protein HY958_03765, partial [Bacteroidia bacterium]|nr:hypothetical protein [Bacteroidia bacterium]
MKKLNILVLKSRKASPMTLRVSFFLIFLLLAGFRANAQCACAATDYASINVAGWTAGQSANITTCQYAGERSTIFNTVAGAVYLISSCGASYDSQLSIYTTGCSYVAYNDDNGVACAGSAASVQFISPGGNLYSVLNQYSCVTNSTCTTVSIQLVSLPAATATTTVNYTGFQACGGCAVCGSDYWCINTPGSYCGNTPACDTKTFFDPVPAGHVVTNATINYWTASCDGSAIYGTINGFAVPTAYDGSGGCLCSASPCALSTSTTGNYPCGMPGYVYGGTNTLQICTSTDMCINRAVLVFTYVDPDVITPSIDALGPLTFCQGGSVVLDAGSGYSAYNWSTGATSQTITATTSGTYSVTVTSITGCTTGSSSATVTVTPNPTMGTLSNAGPINFCNSSGDWSSVPISVSGATGTVWWQYGWSSGGWSGDWVSGTSPGYCCFPKKVSTSDGNPDRIRYYVKNGTCPPTGYSSTILIQNRYNEAPGSLTASSNNVCSGTAVTLTANFPTNINILGTVQFFSGSCGGTLIATVSAGNNVNSVSTSITPPVGTTTYYVRYNPGTGSGCSTTSCVSTTVTVNPVSNAGTITQTPASGSTVCVGNNVNYQDNGITGTFNYFEYQWNGTGGAWSGSWGTTNPWNWTSSNPGNILYVRAVVTSGVCPSAVSSPVSVQVVPNNTITLTSGNNVQTRCINTAISNITYSTTGATGATFSGLSAGVSGSWAANVVTISGTPTASGTFNYTVTLTGGCGTATASGTITVTPNNTITLTAGGTQTKCINTAITTTTYSTTGATGATVTGLPAGVTGNWAANVVTISGTPTVSGTFNYTVTLTGGCGTVTASGTITVTPNNTITLTAGGTQTVCINTAITTTTYATTGATGATITGLPAGVTGSWAANVVTISGTPTASGTFNYTVTLTGGCGTITANGTITVTPNNTITLTAGGTQTVCINTAITTTTYATTGAT